MLSDVEYALVPGTTPFAAPAFPQPLVIPNTATAVEALGLRTTYLEAKNSYIECKNIERALLRHIQDAIEEKYVEVLVDEFTSLITDDIPTVLQYFFNTCGKIRGEEVAQREAEVMSITWQPNGPLVLLTRPIETLQKMAIQAGIPFSTAQLLDKGLQIIKNTRDYEIALTAWNAKPAVDKTWDNFKTHFQAAQQSLKEVRGPTMQQAGYHHANALASQLRTELQVRDTDVLAMLQTISDNSTITADTATSTITESLNIATQQTTQLEILQLLRDMQTEFRGNGNPRGNGSGTLTGNQRGNGSGGRGNGGRAGRTDTGGRGSRGRKTADNTVYPRAQVDKYCWTHGGRNHTSSACERKAPGHQTSATFEDRQNGSNAYCET